MIKPGNYNNLEEFLKEYSTELSDKEESLLWSISDEYGFRLIQVTSDWFIAIYTQKEPPFNNQFCLDGVWWPSGRGLIIRKP